MDCNYWSNTFVSSISNISLYNQLDFMEKRIEKFLEFEGKVLPFLSVDGIWYIAVKPICEALGVEYTRTFKNLKEDEFLSQLLAEQPMVATDGKLRKMICLPERYVYGWLFGIRSESPELKAYKMECYDVLYNHFHGPLTKRVEALRTITETERQIKKLASILAENPDYVELIRLRSLKGDYTKQLTRLDESLRRGQVGLFENATDE